MTVVTVTEATERLPELLQRAAAGEVFVVADGDRWLASIAAPPVPPAPPTTEEEAQRRARAEELERQIAQWHAEDGLPYPPTGESPVLPRPEVHAEEEAVLARRELLIRAWLRLRPDAPLPIPEGMSHEVYFAQYQESE